MRHADGDFEPLASELRRWTGSDRECRLWWRDDDFVTRGPSYARLEETVKTHGVAPLINVIPELADRSSGQCAADPEGIIFGQHGLAHRNHETPGEPPSEFGSRRPLDAIEGDLRLGSQYMGELFGSRFLPVFVPPWNRITDEAAALLPRIGLRGLSQYGPRHQAEIGSVLCVNSHLDIMDWGTKPAPRVQPSDLLAARLADVLRGQREGENDPSEPVGVLTHHRVMDEDAWQFVERLFAVTREFDFVRWMSPTDVFA